jgi:glutathione-regulated potassium-efflux system ancillary protein KefF
MILVVLAHPYPDRSTANRTLLGGIEDLRWVEVRSLYDLYPIYWYNVPALLKLWFEKVLTFGWAWGPGVGALRGKGCLWVVTTGGDDDDYQPEGLHGHHFDAFAPGVLQTARFCGMEWLDPIVVHDARELDGDSLAAWAATYRERLIELSRRELPFDA